MRKLALVPSLLIIACVFAGVFGAVHDQISYTVSPEYFTKLKFTQFGVAAGLPERAGAAIVGWLATWWMGIVIGVVLCPLGLVVRGAASYFRTMIKVFGVVAATALVVGLIGLGLSFIVYDPARMGDLTIYGNKITDVVSFERVGMMHGFSYLGGLIGILTGGIAIFGFRRNLNTVQSP